jgi:hypothetical protein
MNNIIENILLLGATSSITISLWCVTTESINRNNRLYVNSQIDSKFLEFGKEITSINKRLEVVENNNLEPNS